VRKIRSIFVGTVFAIMLSACASTQPVTVDPDRLEEQYQYCVEKGGSFSTERGGFSCSLPEN